MASFGGLAAALAIYACENRTGPLQTPHANADWRSVTKQNASIPIPPDNGGAKHGAVDWMETSITLPPNQWVSVGVTGGVTLQTNPECEAYAGCYFPRSGQTIDAYGIYPDFLKVHLSYNGGPELTLTDDGHGVPSALFWSGSGGSISVERTGIEDGANCFGTPDANGITNCPTPGGTLTAWYLGGYLMSGDQEIVAKIVDPIEVHGNPTSIHPGDTVHFTATRPGTASFTQIVWRWVPGEIGKNQQDVMQSDALPAGGQSVGCAVGNTCNYAPTSPGRMYAAAQDNTTGLYVHGSSEFISINSGKLLLTANPNSGLSPGEVVTYTASTTDNSTFTVQSWSFQPDKGSDGPLMGGCGAGVNPCIVTATYTGTMYVTVQLDGATQIASAHVIVTPCTTVGDSILDGTGVVDSLTAALYRSGVGGSPGDGSIKERGGVIWRRLDGSYFVTELTPLAASECGITLPGGTPALPPSELAGDPIAAWHTHPELTGQELYGCPSRNGQNMAQTPGDGLPREHAAPTANGGGSDADWEAADSAGTQYIVSLEGNIYRLDAGVSAVDRKNNPHHWNWQTHPGCVD